MMVGESFGMNPYNMARGGGNTGNTGKSINSDIKKPSAGVKGSRQMIEDNFLEEDYEDDFGSIRAS